MKFRPGMEGKYQEGYNKHLDPYGHAVYSFAERWAELMEKDIEACGEPTAAAIANFEKRSIQADTEGITGFMYGVAVSILSDCWEYGEILREWHNKNYGYKGDGVVNPAILTISPK